MWWARGLAGIMLCATCGSGGFTLLPAGRLIWWAACPGEGWDSPQRGGGCSDVLVHPAFPAQCPSPPALQAWADGGYSDDRVLAAWRTDPPPTPALQAWADGGYSDDLVLAAWCTERALAIAAPSHALYAQHLAASYPPAAYWNYLRRQLFVLDTYTNAHNRRLNHTMALVHSWGSCCVAGGLSAGLLQAACVGAAVALHLAFPAACRGVAPTAGSAGACTPGAVGATQCAAAPSSGWQLPGSWWLLAASACLAQGGMAWMVGEARALLCQLQRLQLRSATGVPVGQMAAAQGRPASPPPHRPGGPLAPAQLDPAGGAAAFDWVKLWAAWLLESSVLPLCMAYTFACAHVDWSGVRYHRQHGRVVRVARRAGTPAEVG